MKRNIFACRQRKIDIHASMQALHDAAKQQGRDLTPAEAASFEKYKLALTQAEAEIVEAEKELAIAAGVPHFQDENMAFAALARGEHPEQDPTVRKKFGRVGCRSWSDVFGMQPRNTAGFKGMGDFLHSVRFSRQMFDPRLQVMAAGSMTEAVPSDGGFLVPEVFSAQLLQNALESAIVLPRAQVFPMSSATLKVPGVKDTDHSSGTLFGGITETWYNELDTFALQAVKFYRIQLSAKKLGMLANASSEETDDSNPSLESVLTAKLQAAASYFLDKNFLFGPGANKPLGIFDASNPALVAVTKNSATPNGTIQYDDILAMYAAMAPACRSRASWIFTDQLIPSLLKLQNVVTNKAGTENVGGSAVPLLTSDGSGGFLLLSRPVLFSEHMKGAGYQGDAGFVCFDQYAVGIRKDTTLARSDQAGFTNDSVYWRLITRVDGQPTWVNTLTLEDGTVTSPFVTLTARHA